MARWVIVPAGHPTELDVTLKMLEPADALRALVAVARARRGEEAFRAWADVGRATSAGQVLLLFPTGDGAARAELLNPVTGIHSAVGRVEGELTARQLAKSLLDRLSIVMRRPAHPISRARRPGWRQILQVNETARGAL